MADVVNVVSYTQTQIQRSLDVGEPSIQTVT